MEVYGEKIFVATENTITEVVTVVQQGPPGPPGQTIVPQWQDWALVHSGVNPENVQKLYAKHKIEGQDLLLDFHLEFIGPAGIGSLLKIDLPIIGTQLTAHAKVTPNGSHARRPAYGMLTWFLPGGWKTVHAHGDDDLTKIRFSEAPGEVLDTFSDTSALRGILRVRINGW